MENTTQAVADPSMRDLRAMLGTKTEEPPSPEASGTQDAPLELPSDKQSETVTEAVEKKQEPEEKQEPAEEELPKGVQKRIAKEVERQHELDRKIKEAVAATKAKEAEFAKVASATGTEPDKTEPATKLVRPEFKDGETWDQFQKRVADYDEARYAQVREEAKLEARREIEEHRVRDAGKKMWDSAIEKHGADFPAKVDALRSKIPEPLQIAIGKLEDWPSMAVHLAGNDEDLQLFQQAFEVDPARGMAVLGRIEAKLTTPKKSPAKANAAELPEPPSRVGGRSSPSSGDVDLEAVSMSQFKAEVNRRVKRTG